MRETKPAGVGIIEGAAAMLVLKRLVYGDYLWLFCFIRGANFIEKGYAHLFSVTFSMM